MPQTSALWRQANHLAKTWYPVAGVFGTVGVMMFLYVSDWRVICDKIPFYNTKFEKKDA